MSQTVSLFDTVPWSRRPDGVIAWTATISKASAISLTSHFWTFRARVFAEAARLAGR
jgi:hypothetical protein